MTECSLKACGKPVKYGFKRDGKKVKCLLHREEGMVDLGRKLCLESECDMRASFNVSGEKCGMYCSKHRKENMVDVVSDKCLECNMQASCNFSDKKKRLYCSKHS